MCHADNYLTPLLPLILHKTVHSHSIGDGDKVHISSTVVIYEEFLQQPKVNCDIP